MDEDLNEVIKEVRQLLTQKNYRECEKLLASTMANYPDDPIPHNLLGLVYEKQDDHIAAMKHFRVAWALDPSYKAALQNLDNFGTLFANKTFIFDESDYETKAKGGH